MKQRDSETMNFIVTGIGAGLVSALLTIVLMKGTLLALVLSVLSPLPIFIVSLGWSHRSGLVAILAGAMAVAVAISPFESLGFALLIGLPAWWLSYLALLGRPGPAGAVEWYPLSRLLAWIATIGALMVFVTNIMAGDYETFRVSARNAAQALFAIQFPDPAQNGIDGETQETFIGIMTDLVPVVSSSLIAAMLAFYLWIAAKVVAMSGRLPRPWPALSETLMPRRIGVLLVGAYILGFAPGFFGFFGLALMGGLLMAFALQGLAGIHEGTRGKAWRSAVLAGLYILILVTQGALMIALSLFGIADTVFGLRRRMRRKTGPKLPPLSP